MSGIDITDYVRVQSICAGNGIVLENKLKEKEKATKKVKKDIDIKDTFLYEFVKVHTGRTDFFEEKTAK